MKYQEYDSPFGLVVSGTTTQMARNIDEMSWQAVQRVGINVNKDKLLTALKQDADRYREAYKKGYDTGYEKRDDDIVRCKDCKRRLECDYWIENGDDWFCADGKRESVEEEEP